MGGAHLLVGAVEPVISVAEAVLVRQVKYLEAGKGGKRVGIPDHSEEVSLHLPVPAYLANRVDHQLLCSSGHTPVADRERVERKNEK